MIDPAFFLEGPLHGQKLMVEGAPHIYTQEAPLIIIHPEGEYEQTIQARYHLAAASFYHPRVLFYVFDGMEQVVL